MYTHFQEPQLFKLIREGRHRYSNCLCVGMGYDGILEPRGEGFTRRHVYLQPVLNIRAQETLRAQLKLLFRDRDRERSWS